MIRVGVVGATGRMGVLVGRALVDPDPDHRAFFLTGSGVRKKAR